MSDSQNSESKTPESPSYKVVWERDTLERLAFATLHEQRTSRRWRIFFRFAWLGLAAALLWTGVEKSGISASDASQPHTAVVEIKGEIADDTDASADAVVSSMRAAFEDEGSQAVVLLINSPGGSVTAGLAIYDTMQFVTCDVATYCIGQCASMGAVLLTAGAKGKRRALPNSRIMIHQPLAGMEGTAEEIMIHAKEFRFIKQRLNMILQKHTGQPLDKIEEHTDRDNFMAAEVARQYGLIDEVIDRMPEVKSVP